MIKLTENDLKDRASSYVYDYKITFLLFDVLKKETSIIASKCFDLLNSGGIDVYVNNRKMIIESISYISVPDYFYDYIDKIVDRIKWDK